MSIRMTQNEYVVLREYAEMAAGEEYRTAPELATKIQTTLPALKPIINELKSKGLLTGTRKVSITAQGAEIFQEATRSLKERSMAEGESTPVDSSAAMVAAAPEAEAPTADPRKLSEIVAERLHIEPSKLWEVIKNNVISYNKEREPAPTDAEVMQVLSIMHKYQLDPFMKQIHAFRHKGKLQIPVGIDGWIAIANRDQRYGGVEIEYPKIEDRITAPSGGKKAWPWIKATCHVAGRVPTTSIVFLDEWFVGTKYGDGNWEKHPSHRLEMKATTTVIRKALGIALQDEADAEQFHIIEVAEATRIEASTMEASTLLDGIKAENPALIEDVKSGEWERTGTEKEEPGLGDLDELVGGEEDE